MKILLIFIAATVSISCKQKVVPAAKVNGSDTTLYFQLKAYIQNQVKEVNRTPYFIYKLDVYNNIKRDSTPITNLLFNELAEQFQTDINEPSIKQFYTENVFHDETTKSYTLSYSTLNKELVIQSLDVLLMEDAKTVKRIFVRKFHDYGDSTAMEQLSWKPGEQFQINRLVQLGEAKETSHQLVVVWNANGNIK